MRTRGAVSGVIAGLAWYTLASFHFVRLDVAPGTPDSYEIFAYSAPNWSGQTEIRRPFTGYRSIRFPIAANLYQLRLDPGEHPGLIRIQRLCVEQNFVLSTCLDGAALLPYIQSAHDATLTAAGRDLVIVSQSGDPYITFAPALTRALGPANRLPSTLAVALAASAISTYLALSACAALLLWAASNWLSLFTLLRRVYSPVPVTDYWRAVYNFPRYRRFDLTALWQQHNEHRIVFPELAIAADSLFLHGRALLPIALGILFQIATAAVFSALVWRERSLDPKLRCALILLVTGLLGWPGFALFIARPFLVQWMFLQLGVILALLALPRSLVLSIAGAVVATYSSANGMLIWPVLILAAVVLRQSRRQILAVALSGTFFTALYFAGYQPGLNLHLELLFRHPLLALNWVAGYLSLPFGFASAPTGLAVGIAGLLTLAGLLYASLRQSRPPVLFLGIACFVAASAVLTAAARMDPARFVPSTTLSLRFVAVPLCFWASLLCAAAPRLNWWLTAPIAAFVALQFVLLQPWIDSERLPFDNYRLAALALESGVSDSPLMAATLYDDPEMVEQAAPILRANHLSVFASPRYSWLGKPAPFPIDIAPAPGAVISSTLVEGGLQVSGWTLGDWSTTLLLNDRGIVAGFGGFANLEIPSRSVRVYLLRNGRLAPIGAAIPLPGPVPVSYSRMGQFLDGIQWHPDPAFTYRGASPDSGSAPHLNYYGSWSPHHQQGTLSIGPFPAPPGNCIVVPIAHGASAAGQSVRILDAIIPIDRASANWNLWLVPLPSSVHSIEIIAEDHASGKGQWLAVSTPARCTSSY